MPLGTFGEILEVKPIGKDISVLVKGYHRIKLKSFINQTIVEHILENEKLEESMDKVGEKPQASKNATEIHNLKTTSRQLTRLKKTIIERQEKLERENQLLEDGDPKKNEKYPILVDTEKIEDYSNDADLSSSRIKAMTAELVKSLSEIYFYNPLILYFFLDF